VRKSVGKQLKNRKEKRETIEETTTIEELLETNKKEKRNLSRRINNA
jgi:hypothetical protein